MAILPLGNVVLLLHCDDAAASTTLADATQYGQNAKCYGTCASDTAQSKFGGSAVKTGNANGNFFAVGTNQTMDFGTDDFTVEGFLYPVSQGADGGAVLGRWDGTNNDFLLVRNADGSMGVYLNGSELFSTSAGDLPLNAWTHVALVRASGIVTAYIGGVSKGSAAFAAAINCTHGVPLYFGQGNQSGAATWLEAYYDEIRVSNGLAQYTTAFAPPTAPFGSAPVDPYFSQVALLLRFEGSNGSTVFQDSSSKKVTVTPIAAAAITTTNKKFGSSSGSFDGSSGLGVAGADMPFGSQDWTWECWSYCTAIGSNNCYMRGDDGASNNALEQGLVMRLAGSQYVVTVSTTAVIVDSTSANLLKANQWQHIAVVRQGTTIKWYVDGQLAVSGNYSGIIPAPVQYKIGMDAYNVSAGNNFHGQLDEVRVTIGTARYTENFTPPTATFPTTAGGADSSFGKVSVLLHFDGANGATTFTDSSQNGLAVAASGSAALATSQAKFGGAALSLSGSGAVYGTTYENALNVNAPNTSFTVECWAYLNSLSSDPYLVTANSASNSPRWAMQVYGGKLAFYSGGGGSPPVGSVAIPTGQWVHLAVCFDNTTGVLKTFVGGVQDLSASGVLTTGTAPMRLELGAAYFNGSNFVNGYLDDVRITKGLARYSGTFTPPDAAFPDSAGNDSSDAYFGNVSLLLHCDGPVGGTAYTDSSSWAHAITSNVPVVSASPKFGAGCADCSARSDPYIDVSVGDDSTFGNGDFTVELWAKVFGAPSAYGTLIDFRPTSSNGPYPALFVQGDLSVLSFLNNATALSTSAKLTLDTWTHLALVRKGSTTTLYINGVSAGSYGDTNTYAAVSRVRLGRSGWASATDLPLNGQLDEVRVTKGVARYTANFTPPTSPFPDASSSGPAVPRVTKIVGALQRPFKLFRPLAPSGTKRLFRVHRMTDYYTGGSGTISGKVTVNDNPDSRKVRLYELRSGRLLRTTWSAADGTYKFTSIDPTLTYFVVGHDYTKTYNAVIQDMVKPV